MRQLRPIHIHTGARAMPHLISVGVPNTHHPHHPPCHTTAPQSTPSQQVSAENSFHTTLHLFNPRNVVRLLVVAWWGWGWGEGGCTHPCPPSLHTTSHHTTPKHGPRHVQCESAHSTCTSHSTLHRTADFFAGHRLQERTNTELRAHTCSTTCLERKLLCTGPLRVPFVFLRRVFFLLRVSYISLGEILCE